MTSGAGGAEWVQGRKSPPRPSIWARGWQGSSWCLGHHMQCLSEGLGGLVWSSLVPPCKIRRYCLAEYRGVGRQAAGTGWLQPGLTSAYYQFTVQPKGTKAPATKETRRLIAGHHELKPKADRRQGVYVRNDMHVPPTWHGNKPEPHYLFLFIRPGCHDEVAGTYFPALSVSRFHTFSLIAVEIRPRTFGRLFALDMWHWRVPPRHPPLIPHPDIQRRSEIDAHSIATHPERSWV